MPLAGAVEIHAPMDIAEVMQCVNDMTCHVSYTMPRIACATLRGWWFRAWPVLLPILKSLDGWNCVGTSEPMGSRGVGGRWPRAPRGRLRA